MFKRKNMPPSLFQRAQCIIPQPGRSSLFYYAVNGVTAIPGRSNRSPYAHKMNVPRAGILGGHSFTIVGIIGKVFSRPRLQRPDRPVTGLWKEVKRYGTVMRRVTSGVLFCAFCEWPWLFSGVPVLPC